MHSPSSPGRLRAATVVSQALKSPSLSLGFDLEPEEIASGLGRPPRPEMGDYALPCFRYAAQAKIKPIELAARLRDAVMALGDPWVVRAEIEGAFLNLTLDPARWADAILDDVRHDRMFEHLRRGADPGAAPTMIEYSQPNTHKEFHVGHLRNVALGDSLRRICEYCGDRVIAANYVGDLGTHVAKCIWYLQKQRPEVPERDRGVWLGGMYAAAVRDLESGSEDERAAKEQGVSRVLAEIEQKQGAAYDLWMTTRQWSLDLFREVYQALDARFDHYFYESELSDEAQQIVDQFLERGVFVRSEGAIGVDLKEHKLGFLLLRKRDGTTLYATKDLALARRKIEDFHVRTSIYVVGSEQQLHFRQVFKTLELMGFGAASRCFHLSYGLVTLPEGKMSSRAGTAIPFRHLHESMRAALRAILKKYEGDWSPAEIDDTADRLCVGALKYGMIASDPQKTLVFDRDKWLAFEGDTGPYLMYCYTRARSILAKGLEGGQSPAIDAGAGALLSSAEERDLLRYLHDLNEAVLAARRELKPSLVAIHLYDMCRSFNRFYSQNPVLKATDPAIVRARLALTECFGKTLKRGMDLLGMSPPERM